MKKDWVLTRKAFDDLLALFDAEPERAAEKYELIRLHLIKMFEGRGCNSSVDLADEVINRVIRRMEGGEEIIPATMTNYFYGVARNVLREYQRSPESLLHSIDSPDIIEASLEKSIFNADSADSADREMDCLESCLKELPLETQHLILAYYDWEAGDKIASRRRLAEQMGVSLNTLRIRAHRVRDAIEKCAAKCLENMDG